MKEAIFLFNNYNPIFDTTAITLLQFLSNNAIFQYSLPNNFLYIGHVFKLINSQKVRLRLCMEGCCNKSKSCRITLNIVKSVLFQCNFKRS